MQDLTKIRCGIRENSKYLEGKGIWLLLGKRDTLEFGHRMRDFLVCLSGIRDIVHSNSYCETTRRTYSSVYYQSKLFKQSSNQQMSSQKIKTQCLNCMPAKCTWYLNSRINSKQIERAKLHLLLISFCSNKSFSNLLILETKIWDLGKRWKKCGMWDFREKGERVRDQDGPYQTLIIIVYPY